jgi:hypothetical protein
MAYVLDADVFIRAKNLHCGLDFCPGFWEWLIIQNAAERLFSIEKVGDEIHAVADELSVWAAARGQGFFLRPDATVFPALAAVSTWARGQRYEAAAVSQPRRGAAGHPHRHEGTRQAGPVPVPRQFPVQYAGAALRR